MIFEFERDFAGALQCIPMVVRFKLDACGVKLSLRQWNRFSRNERQTLVSAPCGAKGEVAEYRTELIRLINARAGEMAVELPIDPAPEWADTGHVPGRLAHYAAQRGLSPPSLDDWASLAPLQRFALVKLSRPAHDNDNFEPAFCEFGLARR
jgi:hypothetical protein